MCKTGTRGKQVNLIYNEDFLDHVEDLYLNEGKTMREIRVILGLKKSQLEGLMSRHGISKNPKVYTVPDFKGWDFKPDNEERPQW